METLLTSRKFSGNVLCNWCLKFLHVEIPRIYLTFSEVTHWKSNELFTFFELLMKELEKFTDFETPIKSEYKKRSQNTNNVVAS